MSTKRKAQDRDSDSDRVPDWALELLEEVSRTTRLYDIAGYAVLIDSETLYVVTIGHIE